MALSASPLPRLSYLGKQGLPWLATVSKGTLLSWDRACVARGLLRTLTRALSVVIAGRWPAQHEAPPIDAGHGRNTT